MGIAQLCVMAMQAEGTSIEDARDKIWMVDSKGLIVKDRPEGGVTGHKVHYARNHTPIKNLKDVIREAKPSVIIGEILSAALNICLKQFFLSRCCSYIVP